MKHAGYDVSIALLGIFTAILFFLSALSLGYQVYEFLKDGIWPSYTGEDFLFALRISSPTFSWVGVQKIYIWITRLPLPLLFFIAGGLLWWITIAIANERDAHVRALDRQSEREKT